MVRNREALLSEAVRLLGCVPTADDFKSEPRSFLAWLGQSEALFEAWDPVRAVKASSLIRPNLGERLKGHTPRSEIIIFLEKVKRNLELEVGYSIPRNYLELTAANKQTISKATLDLENAVRQDNEIDATDREILLSEIAIFEASIGAARLAPDLIHRFVTSVLNGAIILAAGEIIKKAAADLVTEIFKIFDWPLG